MQIERHKDAWWFTPEIDIKRVRVPRHFRNVDPLNPAYQLPAPTRQKTAAFAPSRLWVPYHRLQPIDAGYIVPLYTLGDIAKRYKLSTQSKAYFKKHILPEPFTIMRRRSVSAHHWPRFTLMVLDLVLKDLERRGELRFLRKYQDHIALLHNGVSYLSSYYEGKTESDNIRSNDKFGVQWLHRPD